MFQFLKKCALRIKNGGWGKLVSSEPVLRCDPGRRNEARSRILEQRRRLWSKLPRVDAEEIRSWREQGRG
jgi:hypothetical protein